MEKILEASIPGIRASSVEWIRLLLRRVRHQVVDEGEPGRRERLHRHGAGRRCHRVRSIHLLSGQSGSE